MEHRFSRLRGQHSTTLSYFKHGNSKDSLDIVLISLSGHPDNLKVKTLKTRCIVVFAVGTQNTK